MIYLLTLLRKTEYGQLQKLFSSILSLTASTFFKVRYPPEQNNKRISQGTDENYFGNLVDDFKNPVQLPTDGQ
jgi:hypothetical protein